MRSTAKTFVPRCNQKKNRDFKAEAERLNLAELASIAKAEEDRNNKVFICKIYDEFSQMSDGDSEVRVIELMTSYKKLTSNYPYSNQFFMFPNALKLYLIAQGITKEVVEDMKTYIYHFSKSAKDDVWKLLKDYVSPSDVEMFYLSVDSAKVIIDATVMRYVDHRLESAIVRMQRLIRRVEYDRPEHPSINVKSLDNVREYLNGDFTDEETSFVRWNSHLTAEYVSCQVKQTLVCSSLRFFEGAFDTFIFDERIGSISDLVLEKKKEILKSYEPHFKCVDTIIKMTYLYSCYLNGDLLAKRCKLRDTMKFVSTNSPMKDVLIVNATRTILSLPIAVNKDILSILPMITLEKGEMILRKFSATDLDKMSIVDLKACFLDIIVESYEDFCKNEEVTKEKVMEFIETELCDEKAEALCRRKLKKAQRAVRMHKPLYELKLMSIQINCRQLTI